MMETFMFVCGCAAAVLWALAALYGGENDKPEQFFFAAMSFFILGALL